MRTDSAPFRPSAIDSPVPSESADYLALENDTLVVRAPATPQPKRGLLGALLRSRSDSKDGSSVSWSSSAASSASPSASRSRSPSRSSASEPSFSAASDDMATNQRLLAALASYASRLGLPRDGDVHKSLTLLERSCVVLSPQEFGRSALKVYAQANWQAPAVMDDATEEAVRAALDGVAGKGASSTPFASVIGSREVLAAHGCRLEVHQGGLVVLASTHGLTAAEVSQAHRIDAKIRKGKPLTADEDNFQSQRSSKGKEFMQSTFPKGIAKEDGLYGAPKVGAPEHAAANEAANRLVLDAVKKRLREAGVVPSLIADLNETMRPVLESPPELFAYRLADRTKSWDERLGYSRRSMASKCTDAIVGRLKDHLSTGALGKAEQHMLPAYAKRAFVLALDQELALQRVEQRESKRKSHPDTAPIQRMSVEALTDMAVQQLRVTDLKAAPGTLRPLPPPMPPELVAQVRAMAAPKDDR